MLLEGNCVDFSVGCLRKVSLCSRKKFVLKFLSEISGSGRGKGEREIYLTLSLERFSPEI